MTTSCCDKGPRRPPYLLKFSGLVPLTSVNATTFLSDGLVVSTTPPLAYPLAQSFSALRLSFNVIGAGLGPNSTLRVRLLRDGVAVPGFELNYGGLNQASGIQAVSPAAVLFKDGQTLSLELVTTGITEVPPLVAATLKVRPTSST